MGKGILGWLRQRRVEVVCGIIWFSLVLVFVYVTWALISERVGSENAGFVWWMHIIFIGSPGLVTLSGALNQRDGWRAVLAMRVILMLVQVCIFWCVFVCLGGDSLASYLRAGNPELALVSTYEVFFIYSLSLVCAVFQCWMIVYERRRNELSVVVGGVLGIIGILLPRLLESYSILGAYCSWGRCASEDLDAAALFETGIACAAALAAMFVVGLFSEPIIGFFRSSEEEVSAVSKGPSPAGSHSAEVSVPVSGAAIASDKQNKESEVLPASSSVATRVSQESADGAVVPAQAAEALASACGPGVAVPKQLMGAAVTGLVGGACFSVVNRLFSRR
jgi:hypothetical protein